MDSSIWNHWISFVLWSWSWIENPTRLGKCPRSNMLSYQALRLRCIWVKYCAHENRISLLFDPTESSRKFLEIHSRKRESRLVSRHIGAEFRENLQLHEDNIQRVSCNEDSNFQAFLARYYSQQKAIYINVAKCLKYVHHSWLWCEDPLCICNPRCSKLLQGFKQIETHGNSWDLSCFGWWFVELNYHRDYE